MKTLADASRKQLTDLAGPGWRDGIILLEQWEAIVGPSISRLCSPMQVKFPSREKRDGTLVLSAPAAARLELQHQTPTILARVNQYFGYAAIARIHLNPGALPQKQLAKATETTEDASLDQALEGLRKAVEKAR